MPKPMNSFLIYCKVNRDKVKEAYPDRPNSEISAILGEQWRNMSRTEKKKYQELALVKKQEFLKTNPLPQRQRRDSDPFVFSFRIQKPKPAKRQIQKSEETIPTRPVTHYAPHLSTTNSRRQSVPNIPVNSRVSQRRYSIAPEVDFIGYLNYLEDSPEYDNYNHPPRNYQVHEEFYRPYSNPYTPNYSTNQSPPYYSATSQSPPNLSPPMNYAPYQPPLYHYNF